MLRIDFLVPPQSKKEAEEQRQRELNELFAEAIKQPKVPVGEELLLHLWSSW